MPSARLAVAVLVVGAAAGGAVLGALFGPPRAAPPAPGPAALTFENPVPRNQPGEWALYRLVDGKTLRWTVLEVHPVTRYLTVREEIRDPKTDGIVHIEVKQFPPNHFLQGTDSAGGIVARAFFDEREAAGRLYSCLCVESASRTTGPLRQWFSPEVPVLGLVHQEKIEGGPFAVTALLLSCSKR